MSKPSGASQFSVLSNGQATELLINVKRMHLFFYVMFSRLTGQRFRGDRHGEHGRHVGLQLRGHGRDAPAHEGGGGGGGGGGRGRGGRRRRGRGVSGHEGAEGPAGQTGGGRGEEDGLTSWALEGAPPSTPFTGPHGDGDIKHGLGDINTRGL